MAFEIVGREEELGFLHAFLDQEAGGPLALVLEGEAGIGKSTLWLAGVEAARERGLRVLSSRPAEAERGLAHAVLTDLFEAVLDEVLPALSAPRRHALEVALLVDEASEEPVDPRTLGVAVRTALRALAACRARPHPPSARPRARASSADTSSNALLRNSPSMCPHQAPFARPA